MTCPKSMVTNLVTNLVTRRSQYVPCRKVDRPSKHADVLRGDRQVVLEEVTHITFAAMASWVA